MLEQNINDNAKKYLVPDKCEWNLLILTYFLKDKISTKNCVVVVFEIDWLSEVTSAQTQIKTFIVDESEKNVLQLVGWWW